MELYLLDLKDVKDDINYIISLAFFNIKLLSFKHIKDRLSTLYIVLTL